MQRLCASNCQSSAAALGRQTLSPPLHQTLLVWGASLYSAAADHLSSKSASSASSTSTKTCSFSKSLRAYSRGVPATASAPTSMSPCGARDGTAFSAYAACPGRPPARSNSACSSCRCSADHRPLIELEQVVESMAVDSSSATCSCGLHSPAFHLPINYRGGSSRSAHPLAQRVLGLLARGTV